MRVTHRLTDLYGNGKIQTTGVVILAALADALFTEGVGALASSLALAGGGDEHHQRTSVSLSV